MNMKLVLMFFVSCCPYFYFEVYCTGGGVNFGCWSSLCSTLMENKTGLRPHYHPEEGPMHSAQLF